MIGVEGVNISMSRDYMMRSKSRPRPGTPYSQKSRRPGYRRRRHAGFFYLLVMFLLLLILWPVGLVMLWNKRISWTHGTQLLVTLLTLAGTILFYGFALTVQTGNEQYTVVQETVNDALEDTAFAISGFWDSTKGQAVEAYDSYRALSSALFESSRGAIADGLDAGVVFASDTKDRFLTLTGDVYSGIASLLKGTPETTQEPAVNTVEPTLEPSEVPTAEPTAAPTETAAEEPAAEPTEKTVNQAVTDSAEPPVSETDPENPRVTAGEPLPIYIPSEEELSGLEGTGIQDGVLESAIDPDGKKDTASIEGASSEDPAESMSITV